MNLKMWTACCVALGVLFLSGAFAKDYESVHKLEPGDVVSADVINELFDAVEGFRKSLTEEELIGTWQGSAYALYEGATNWHSGPHGTYWELTNVVLTFSWEDGTNLVMATSAPDPFNIVSPTARTNYVAVKEGMLFSNSEDVKPRIIDRISETRIRMLFTLGVTGMDEIPGPSFLILLDKGSVPPETPKLLSAEADGTNVTLMWEDRSEDETGFVVWRRDKLSGLYSNVQSTAADVTSCVNTAPASGFYWYRVAASNDSGVSRGSNVKRVTVP